MALEYISLAWDGIGLHCPEIDLKEPIKRISPGWHVAHICDDNMLLKNDSLNVALATDYKGSKSLCEGQYGKNLKALRSVGDAIKNVAKFYKIGDMNSRLANAECEFRLLTDSEPYKVEGLTQLEYDQRYFRKGNFKTAKSKMPRPLVTLTDGKPAITWKSNYYRILNEYEHTFSRLFQFDL